MEQTNPYTGLLDLMGNAADNVKTLSCLIGTVSKTAPLTVHAGGLEIDAESIMINPILRANYKRSASFDGAQDDLIFKSGELAAGDLVLLIPSADMQEFYLVCRLEAADG